ncbi:cation diffusion facilitator family transporter [Corynebacterium pelargi]|uniref:Cadmium, cobalt and zinc/H(+)-K(+) antiporter n=1 Tax=Corynebacterium pelargi TaxID=1471400 RepID=A0A410W9A5_9CORY|nr:cation diffusion facilitator family transporter [Corynebacterium pelargi]QAU52531.1 Cadmium, cobalt and zinc/H(+)-K(+) antiporter [Corynebacterium pelargi]GGG77070.1 cobalt transporter [Corynebacterium pelargi]
MHSHAENRGTRSLLIALCVTGSIFLVELIGGALAGSLALISDAMHMLSDSTGLVVALVATLIARKAASAKATYGYKRLEVFAAMLNAATVAGVSIWIVLEAFHRLSNGADVDARTTLLIGTIGLAANIISALVLRRDREHSLNIQGAYLHVLVDLFGSVAVIIASVCMLAFGWTWADTIASLVIAALILPRAMQLLWHAMSVLLERVPAEVDVHEIRTSLESLQHVTAVHDLHVWSLDGAEILATCHLVVEGPVTGDCDLLDRAQAALQRHGVGHSTIQIEVSGHGAHEEVCHHS